MDDLDLIAAWSNGDSDSGEILLERYLETVQRFFSNKTRGSSTEDLVQKTFLACIESIDRFQGRSSFHAYILAIARNILYRHYRDEHRGFDPLTSSIISDKLDDGSLADQVATHQQQRQLLRALRTLPLELQTLLELAYWEGLADRELAEIMEIPVGTIKSRLRKARSLLDQELSAQDSAPGLLESSHCTLSAWATELRNTNLAKDGKGRR